jgi:hypothetical protein
MRNRRAVRTISLRASWACAGDNSDIEFMRTANDRWVKHFVDPAGKAGTFNRRMLSANGAEVGLYDKSRDHYVRFDLFGRKGYARNGSSGSWRHRRWILFAQTVDRGDRAAARRWKCRQSRAIESHDNIKFADRYGLRTVVSKSRKWLAAVSVAAFRISCRAPLADGDVAARPGNTLRS